MNDCSDPHLLNRWFPVARSEDAVERHVVHGQLLGQEIAIWRDDDGAVNVWENRCPHRGVRLSIGTNMGRELRCRYHGWRYASGTGQCTAIPAHPALSPPGVLRAKPYACVEKYGYVWACLGEADAQPEIPALDGGTTTLRSVFIHASAPLVAERLLEGDGIAAPAQVTDPFMIEARATDPGPVLDVVFLLQPVTQDQVVVHAAVTRPLAGPERIALLKRHNARLGALRRAIEASWPDGRAR